MAGDRLYLDTCYFIGVLNKNDELHKQAVGLMPTVEKAEGVWVTESVLTELGNHMAKSGKHLREAVSGFIDALYGWENVHIVEVGTDLFGRGLALYESRPDKNWGLTDCISFVVMEEFSITDAVTDDHHFVQASFKALMG